MLGEMEEKIRKGGTLVDRRTLLSAPVAMVFPSLLGGVLESPSRFGSSLAVAESTRVVGQIYLEHHLHEADLRTLTDLLGALVPCRTSRTAYARRQIAAQIQSDFTHADTVCIHGWILSRTEARLCALSFLLGINQ